MTRIERVAIVGLGLMGGSLALTLAARDVTVIGSDSTLESLDAVLDAATHDIQMAWRSHLPCERDTQATNAFLMTSRSWFDGDPQAARGGSS